MFSKALLNEIRDRLSIAAYIGERVPLKRAGRNCKGLCPFHGEKTPSFNVNDDKQIYHCFGCGEGGDIFRFVMKFDGVSFVEAVKHLAGRAGVELPRESSPAEDAAERERERRRCYCLRINELARDHFQQALLGERGAAAREYLQARGMPQEIWTQHFLGYADKGWDTLAGALGRAQAPLDLAADLGLVRRRRDGSPYDFFRDRIIFPILSPRGEVLGFGGRALEERQPDGERIAKYVNSPDSLLYHKSNCVYGLDRAVPAIRSNDAAILVEGYMDFIALHQAGIENVVAPLGTSLTSGHVRLLARYTRNLVLVFDGDAAGRAAALRALPLVIDAGLMPRVATLPAGEDPDTQVRREGTESFRARLDHAPSLLEFAADVLVERNGSDAAGKTRVAQEIVPLLKRVTDAVERDIYVRHLAQRLEIAEPTLRAAVAGSPAALPRAVRQENVPDAGALSAERLLIESLLVWPAGIESVFARLDPSRFEDAWCRTVAELLAGAWHRTGTVRIGDLVEEIDDPELAGQLRAMAVAAIDLDDEELGRVVDDCVDRLLARPVHQRIERINREITRAEREGDEPRLMMLLSEKKRLSEEAHARPSRAGSTEEAPTMTITREG